MSIERRVMSKVCKRQRREFFPRVDGLESRIVPSGAAAGSIRPDATAPYEFLSEAGKVTKARWPSYGFVVHAASTITVEVTPVPKADKVVLESSTTLAQLDKTAGGADFSIVLQPGNYFVEVQGKKKARFEINLYSVAVASNANNPSYSGTFEGIATTRITQVDALTGQEGATNTYQMEETMFLGPRATNGQGDYEDNPFDLVITPTAGNVPGAGGELFLTSAEELSAAGLFTGSFVQNFWTLQTTASGFTGTLTYSKSAAAQAGNDVSGWAYSVADEPQFGVIMEPYFFQDSSAGVEPSMTLTATFTNANTLDVEIQGIAIGGASRALIDISYVATLVS
jgi:hypothetical protein